MKVSVVMATLNVAGVVGAAVASVRAQRGVEVELLVVDGGSADATIELVERHAGPGLRLLQGPDTGIYDALNKGLAAARGDAVYVMGADDRLARPDALARLGACLAAAPRSLVFGDIVVAGPGLERAQSHRGVSVARLGYEPLSHQAVLAPRAAFAEVGAFDTRYRLCADLDWFLRCCGAGFELRHEPLLVCRFSAEGASQRQPALQREELRAILRRHRSAPQRAWQRAAAAWRRRLPRWARPP